MGLVFSGILLVCRVFRLTSFLLWLGFVAEDVHTCVGGGEMIHYVLHYRIDVFHCIFSENWGR